MPLPRTLTFLCEDVHCHSAAKIIPPQVTLSDVTLSGNPPDCFPQRQLLTAADWAAAWKI